MPVAQSLVTWNLTVPQGNGKQSSLPINHLQRTKHLLLLLQPLAGHRVQIILWSLKLPWLVADAPSTLVADFETVAPLSSNDPQSTAPTSSSSPSLQFPQPFIPTSSPPSSALAPDDSCESSVAMVLDPDGSLATPPFFPAPPPSNLTLLFPFPPVDSPNPFSHISSDSYPPPSSAVTHLLVLPAYHHSRPVKTYSFKKVNPCLPFESKFLVSPNPFACLAKEPIPPFDPPVDPCSPSLPAPILPAVGSLLPAVENPTF